MHLLFYNFFLWLYRQAIRLAATWNPKARLWIEGRRDIFQKLEKTLPSHDKELVWIHCASLGEFEQSRPVIESLRARYPQIRILLTFFSSSGYEIRKDYPLADYIFYLPADSRHNARRFLDILRPKLVLWIKYEYWYYYLAELKKRQIPTLLVSGVFRPGQPFFKWYGRMHRSMLDCFSHLFVQTEDSMQLLRKTGLQPKVTVAGDTRFDQVTGIAGSFKPIPVVERFCDGRTVIVAGSTWKEDEEELDHYANTHPDYRFIIAPHEVDEGHLKDIEKLFHHSVRYSRLTDPFKQGQNNYPEKANTLIIDNIGMLSRLYHYARITYIGGGFGEDGVHNVLEAAVYGKPVVFGPVFDKYVEAVELQERGGAFSIESALELEKVLDNLLDDGKQYEMASETARQYVFGKKGATQQIMAYIQENRLLTS